MTTLLVDTSVLITWFHAEGEPEVGAARAIRDAHLAGELDARVIDLAVYEVGNVLVRALQWDADRVADQLADLIALVGPPLPFEALATAAHLAEHHRLTYYDAAWAATAVALGIGLVSSDRVLVATGLAERPFAAAARLRLTGGAERH